MILRTRILFQEISRLLLLVPFLYIFSFLVRISRIRRKSARPFIGFGPTPINFNHSRACQQVGLQAESYVTHMYRIGGTPERRLYSEKRFLNFLIQFFCLPYLFAVTRYSHLAFYFDCGPLGHGTILLWRFESSLLRMAGIKTILMPYGADVHSLKKVRDPELLKAYMLDYPNHWRSSKLIEQRIDYWSKRANYIIAGCDWIDYLPRWNKLVLAHFAIELKCGNPEFSNQNNGPFRILHAPNHRNLKGTSRIEEAVSNLRTKGLDVELTLLSGVPHQKVIGEIGKHHLVVDQLVIGWYAQFALEALVAGIPTICFIKKEYLEFYSSLLAENGVGLPFINANVDDIQQVILWCYKNRHSLSSISNKGFAFVQKYHSLEAIGHIFREAVEAIS